MNWSDDEGNRSPPLQAIIVKRTPSPDLSLLIPQPVCSSSPDSDRDSALRKGKKGKNPQPTQGDAVLVRFMSNGNRPDLAFEAGEKLLGGQENDAETASADDFNDEMGSEPPDIQSETAADTPKTPQDSVTTENEPEIHLSTVDQERYRPKLDTSSLATKQKPSTSKEGNSVKAESAQYPYLQRKPPPMHGDGVPLGLMSNGNPQESAIDSRKRPFDRDSPKPTTPAAEHPNGVAQSPSTAGPPFVRPYDHNHHADTDSIATSPNLAQYTITDSQGSPMDTLAPLQNSPVQSMRSPTAQQSLPSLQSQLGSLSNVPPPPLEAMHPTQSTTFPPRPSFNPVNGSTYSPPQAFKPPRTAHYPSIQTRTNGFHGFPTTEPSPASTVSDASHPSPRETYRPGQDPTSMSPPGTFGPPRPIQSNGYTPGSDVSVQTPQSAESRHSVSSFSTETSPGGDRMSIDGERPVLPLPSPNEPIVSGGFKCDYSGCIAPPFQTQYLLK